MPLGRGGAMRPASVLRPVRLSGRVARASVSPVLHAPTAVFPSEFMSGTPRTVHCSLLVGCGREAEQRIPCDEATCLVQRFGGHPPLSTCQAFRAPAPCLHNARSSADVAPSAATPLAGGARSRQRRTADCEGRAPTRARRRMPSLRNSYAVCVAERRAAHGRTGMAPRVVGAPADGQLGPDTCAGVAHRAHRVCTRWALAQNERRGGARGGGESARPGTRGRGLRKRGTWLAEEREGEGKGMLAAALTALLASTIGAARLAECAGKALSEAQAVQICASSAAMKTAALSAREASSGLRSLTHLEAGDKDRRAIAAAARMGSTSAGQWLARYMDAQEGMARTEGLAEATETLGVSLAQTIDNFIQKWADMGHPNGLRGASSTTVGSGRRSVHHRKRRRLPIFFDRATEGKFKKPDSGSSDAVGVDELDGCLNDTEQLEELARGSGGLATAKRQLDNAISGFSTWRTNGVAINTGGSASSGQVASNPCPLTGVATRASGRQKKLSTPWGGFWRVTHDDSSTDKIYWDPNETGQARALDKLKSNLDALISAKARIDALCTDAPPRSAPEPAKETERRGAGSAQDAQRQRQLSQSERGLVNEACTAEPPQDALDALKKLAEAATREHANQQEEQNNSKDNTEPGADNGEQDAGEGQGNAQTSSHRNMERTGAQDAQGGTTSATARQNSATTSTAGALAAGVAVAHALAAALAPK
ncbi:hypothetical protein, conserved in T. vivax [Trypanosoma vivax Y486]|uniref:Uncharacterized protein n=1 Tax=Trypanosoma vivax (strain Y486) TaxID=1055687 RepID=F9WN07_TRYVY|nr:hypothetical protein, conserved in T. vivax [Trypanosoma vivax Y486]|eukprot:CCD18920.1 hypothetical protein, conserved in T. vivax [Trypanosoma vivax Y486]